MSWAQRLKRVFSIDITTCAHCGGAAVRIVASIEEPIAIRAILAHFEKHGALEQARRPAARRRQPRDEVPATQPAAKPESDPMRPRPGRAALGPVPGFGEKWLRTEPLRGPAMSKTHA